MSHDHKKKHHHHDHGTDKKKTEHHGHEKGVLSDAMMNRDDDDERTPGIEKLQVTADSPKNVGGDIVAVDPKGAYCEVTVNVGSDQGIVEEMNAYMRGSDQTDTDYPFSITEVRPGATKGYVHTSAEQIAKHTAMHVVFNPG